MTIALKMPLTTNSRCMDGDAWSKLPSNVYRCKVYLYPEEEGGYSAVAADLPGAVSQGDSETEALDNIKEAIIGLMESYRASESEIPWEPVAIESGSNPLRRVVMIHA